MTNRIKRHPDAATLMSFAAGSLSEALSAVVSAHLSLCRQCRGEVRDLEYVGAALIEEFPTTNNLASVAPDIAGLQNVKKTSSLRLTSTSLLAGRLPATIAARYSLSDDTIPWKRLGPGIWHHRLELSPGLEGDLRLLKIGAGRRMPNHGHGGEELTLVLDGAYRDETGEYRRGDIQDVDSEIEHRPVADEQFGCMCLIASERPARFKGFIGRLLQPWTGM
jgi:putative transcriptional regulator